MALQIRRRNKHRTIDLGKDRFTESVEVNVTIFEETDDVTVNAELLALIKILSEEAVAVLLAPMFT